MVKRLNSTSPDFDASFDAYVAKARAADANVSGIVSDIISDVRDRGMDAVADYTGRFDGFLLNAETVRVKADEISSAVSACDPDIIEALEFAAARIRSYHEKQLPTDVTYTDDMGVQLGWRWTSVEAAGLYAPGGRAAYPSSVLMNAIPAKVAGVDRLAMVTPTPDGETNAAVLTAARIAGVDEVYRIGGAQSIAALAFGATPIAPVDVIVGPGNSVMWGSIVWQGRLKFWLWPMAPMIQPGLQRTFLVRRSMTRRLRVCLLQMTKVLLFELAMLL